MDRAFSTLTIRTIDADQRVVEGIASTPRVDRQRDSVDPLGAEFELPIPFLLDHDHLSAVGEVESAEVTKTGIRFRARLAKISEPGPVKDLCDSAWTLLRNGLRKFVSIGFRPLDAEPMANGGLRFRAWEWLELSACAVAANPDARITGLKAARRSARAVRIGSKATLYDIAKDFLPSHHLSDHEKRIVRLMREQILRGLDNEIRDLKLGIRPGTRVVRLGKSAGPKRVVRL